MFIKEPQILATFCDVIHECRDKTPCRRLDGEQERAVELHIADRPIV